MMKSGQMKLTLAGQVVELPYELGEMPQLYRALAAFGQVGFLESREGTEKYARYGIAAARPLLSIEGKGRRYVVRDRLGEETMMEVSDPLELLRLLQPDVDLPEGVEGFRYAAGWVGSLGYETSELFEDIPRAREDDIELPDTVFYLPSIVVLKDATSRRLALVALAGDREEAAGLAAQAARTLQEEQRSPDPGPGNEKREARASFGREAFLEAVVRCKELIEDGELIQAVISRRWEVDPAPPPEAVYSALSVLNPSPYHFYLELPGGALLGASPELLVRREGQTLTVRPIAGTRRRGADGEQDLALEKEMLADPKERAEHTMLVDLGRNDLGRVSRAGTVQVTSRMAVERYSHVMHLVSEVRSLLSEEYDSYDVLRACFPAGTVSGAPKIRAMQAIAELEPVVRGPYAGGVGYFDIRGNMDFCITIRSVFYSGGRGFIQSGAGIVADSVPERERDEIAAKAAAMVRAFGDVTFQE